MDMQLWDCWGTATVPWSFIDMGPIPQNPDPDPDPWSRFFPGSGFKFHITKNPDPDLDLDFCGGYVDAEDGSGSDVLAPRSYSPAIITVTDDWAVKGLTPEQGVALFSSTSLGSQYYIDLLAADYISSYHGTSEYTPEELALIEDEDLKKIVQTFADDETALLEAFASGWTYLMTADRFTNNRDNACAGVSTTYKAGDDDFPQDDVVEPVRLMWQ